MNAKPVAEATNPDLAGSLQALQRAAQRAREVAAQTGTAIVLRRGAGIERLTVASANLSARSES